MRDAAEGGFVGRIPAGGGPQEAECGPVVVSGDDRRKDGVPDPERGPRVVRTDPGQPAIVRHGDEGVAITVRPAKIEGTGRLTRGPADGVDTDSDRRVAAAAAAGYGAVGPGQAVVGRDGDPGRSVSRGAG